MTDSTSDPTTDRPSPTPVRDMRKLVGIVLGLTVALGLMLLAFATPAIHSGPHDVPLAVSGPEPAVARLTTMLDEQRPGAFVVTPYAYADDVTAAIEKRDAVGGVSVTPDGVTVQTASAAGAPYATLLQGVGSALAAQGQNVTYVDVVPLTADDPTGAGLSALALPLAFGGLASAVGLVTAFRHSRGLRVAGAIGFAVVAGIAVTAVLQFWLGTLDGPFWSTAAAFALGIGAISLAVLGLESLLGYPGLGLGAVVMMFVANPLSGIATGPAWLPQPWGEIGQFLPIGAAGTAIRSAAFFDGGAGRAVVVLAVWAAAGIALVGISAVRASRRATAVPS